MDQATALTTSPRWTVIGQAETVEPGPNGIYVPGIKVTFRLESGTVGTVFLPQDAYTLEAARAAINAKAATLHAVNGLTS